MSLSFAAACQQRDAALAERAAAAAAQLASLERRRAITPARQLSAGSSELQRVRRRFDKRVSRPSEGTAQRQRFQSYEWTCTGSKPVKPQKAWSSSLQQDIISVATEAGLSRNAAGAIASAAQRGSISSNPGILLSQIVRMLSLEPLLGGHRSTLCILRTMPTLLNHTPEQLSWNVENLATVFDPQQLTGMIQRSPSLLIASPFTIWGNLQALADMLGAGDDVSSVMSLAVRQPGLLRSAPSTLHARFEDLADLCNLTPAALAPLILKQPALLTYCPTTLASNLASLTALLSEPTPQLVLKLLQRQPVLLMLKAESLLDKYTQLGRLLHISGKALSALVLKQPSLLSVSSAGVAAKYVRLKQLLQVDDQQLSSLLCSSPNVLTLASDSFEAKLQLLQQVAALQPQTWGMQLAAAPPSVRAHWACFSQRRFARFGMLLAHEGQIVQQRQNSSQVVGSCASEDSCSLQGAGNSNDSSGLLKTTSNTGSRTVHALGCAAHAAHSSCTAAGKMGHKQALPCSLDAAVMHGSLHTGTILATGGWVDQQGSCIHNITGYDKAVSAAVQLSINSLLPFSGSSHSSSSSISGSCQSHKQQDAAVSTPCACGCHVCGGSPVLSTARRRKQQTQKGQQSTTGQAVATSISMSRLLTMTDDAFSALVAR